MTQDTVAMMGLGRSGSTWISKVIDSSPSVFYLHEPDYVRRVECLPYVSDANDFEVWGRYVNDFVSLLPSLCCSRSALKLPLFPKDYIQTSSERWKYYIFQLKLRADQVRFRGRVRVRRYPASARRAKVLFWKSVNLAGSIGTFLRAVPEQKILHVVRHPCGFIDSVLRGEKSGRLGSKIPSSEDAGLFDFAMRTQVARRLGLQTADWLHFSKVERLAYLWLCINEQAAEDAQGRENYMLVYFDEFCISSLEYAKRVFDFIDLEVTPQTQMFLESSTSKHSSSYYSVNRKSDQVPQLWKGNLDQESIDTILRIANSMPRMAEVIARTS